MEIETNSIKRKAIYETSSSCSYKRKQQQQQKKNVRFSDSNEKGIANEKRYIC